MALAPIAAPNWWGRHYAKISLGLGTATAVIDLIWRHDATSLGHAVQEYISFITLIGALFVVSGGIHFQVSGTATPAENVAFLLIGTLLANLLGTTGAAMLLIRPWMRLNQSRLAAHHIVFFIFLIANVGGCLTPIGDPPLFLGYLQGIPFGWVPRNCWPVWLLGNGLLLIIFYGVDKIHFRRTTSSIGKVHLSKEKRKITGLTNLIFLALILGAVFINQPPFAREGFMLLAAAGSWYTTPKAIHAANRFHFHPLIEVAVLFAGIFITMVPALEWLDYRSRDLLGPDPTPGIFYWSTGALSAVLDNAPTYLGFLQTLFGISGAPGTAELLAQKPAQVLAISIGAVFFGAATYLGNGPNMMIKSIAEQAGVRMPTFLNYLWKFTLPFLLPVLVMVWLAFFHG